MSDLSHWRRTELDKLKQDMDELFDTMVRDFCSPVDLRLLRCEPDVRVVIEQDAVIVTAHAPGLDPSSLKVTVSGRRLSIAGERVEKHQGEGGTAFSRQAFSSVVHLSRPVRTDGVTARYSGGALRIVLPRARRNGLIEVRVDENQHERGSHE